MAQQHTNLLLGDEAVDIARLALQELGEGAIGRHIGVTGMTKHSVTHRFAADLPGYPDWEWHAVLSAAAGSADITVNEVALLPGGSSLTAPEWVPYADRVRPGDLGPGDLMPPAANDKRLDDQGNLTEEGINQAQQRWRNGEYGPTSAMAAAAVLQCRTCAFRIPLRTNFGVCVNEYSADGHVVHDTYGCGAHSKTRVASENKVAQAVYDDEKLIY